QLSYAIVFVATLISLLYRTTKKPEQAWYKCRALAESVKTSTWRYAMRADPFAMTNAAQARTAFREYLDGVLKSNQHIGDKIAGLDASGAQTTEAMDEVRALTWSKRRDRYIESRIRDQ